MAYMVFDKENRTIIHFILIVEQATFDFEITWSTDSWNFNCLAKFDADCFLMFDFGSLIDNSKIACFSKCVKNNEKNIKYFSKYNMLKKYLLKDL